ncbi:hypothetical protein VPHK469_0185 [Vibrio phage K469]
MVKLCSRVISIIDAIHELESDSKKASMTALVSKSQLPYNEGKKALQEAVDAGYVQFLAGPRAYSLVGDGIKLGNNEIEVDVQLWAHHVKVDHRVAPQTASDGDAPKTNTIIPQQPKAPPMGASDKLNAVNAMVEKLGFGIVRETRTEVFFEFTGSKGKFQLYPVRGKWTMYLSKIRGVDMSLEKLNELILGKGDIKSSYVALKDAEAAVCLKTLHGLLS